jgi:hypothetical protein
MMVSLFTVLVHIPAAIGKGENGVKCLGADDSTVLFIIDADRDDRFLAQTVAADGRNVFGALKVSDLFSI